MPRREVTPLEKEKKTFSRYTIVRKLRSPGQHVSAFEATQTGLDRSVELRVLNHRIQDDEPAFLRFQREFQALAQLDHPALIKVLDLGSFDQRVYYTTDMREAPSLAEYAQPSKGRLELDTALELLLPIGEAVDLMHRKEILHRDLSTESIKVDTRTGKAFLASFSLLKQLRLPSLTDRGFKTPVSASAYTPEAAEGSPETVRTDVYLLATVLYQTITGRKIPSALEAAQGIGGKPFDLPPPSDALRGLPDAFDAPLMAALAYDPDQRPPTVGAFLESIQRVRTMLRAKDVARSAGLPTRALRAIRAEELPAPATPVPAGEPAGAKEGAPGPTGVPGQDGPAEPPPLPSARRAAAPSRDMAAEVKPAAMIGAAAVGAIALILFTGMGGEAESPYDTGGAEIVASRAQRRGQLSEAERKALAAQLMKAAAEIGGAPTRPSSFEERWTILHRFVQALPEELRSQHFPKPAMAQIRIAYYRNPQDASRQLDELIAKAERLAKELTAP